MIGDIPGISGGDEDSIKNLQAALNRVIRGLKIEGEADGELQIEIDGGGIAVYDGRRSCCESRYITCDDDLSAFVGATLLGMEVREGPTVYDEYDEHEQQFLIVKTSSGEFTVVTHNEHNGYYGGFWLRIRRWNEETP